MKKHKRFRGLHSYYDSRTKTHHVFTYDPESKDSLTELLIREKEITVIFGVVKEAKA